MKRNPCIGKYFWLVPITLYSMDANAWGLVTHLYFAQSLLWAMPLLDPRLQGVIRRFPELVMAGSCLPDLAIVSPAFRHTHHWENAHHLLDCANSDEEMAIAIGYASHLYVDVIAHNHFVPAHEAMWIEDSMITHIASEWAMDAHLAPLVETTPGKLISKHHKILSRFIAPRFRCSEERTSKALKSLARWDNLLRMVKLTHVIYGTMRLFDKRVFKNFTYYIAKTQLAIANIGTMLQGTRPEWNAELNQLPEDKLAAHRRKCLRQLHKLHPAPINYFVDHPK
ncbi:hypothetical protein A7981_03400 [Methylovorus sp. MM2]|uniref:zinc dependent phospholipase C family protein n=1 Tax=Methylovorus sp. MM2 TaxID=1848038 RepID=UPI0007DFD1B5|nr:zinc dependent phospholipase C family protein [Methylovorus sp. MM2]OAM52528.1 hypothetical protein A7981_03400 [Methylovorus sp. MM2]